MNALETVAVSCPYCGESLHLLIDCSVPAQRYIEDCQVCCQPMNVQVTLSGDALPSVSVQRDDE